MIAAGAVPTIYGSVQDASRRSAVQNQFKPLLGSWTADSDSRMIAFNADGTCQLDGQVVRYAAAQRSEALHLGGSGDGAFDPGVIRIGTDAYYEFKVSDDGRVLNLTPLTPQGQVAEGERFIRSSGDGQPRSTTTEATIDPGTVAAQHETASDEDSGDGTEANVGTDSLPASPADPKDLIGRWVMSFSDGAKLRFVFGEDHSFAHAGPYGATSGTWNCPAKGKLEVTYPHPFGDVKPGTKTFIDWEIRKSDRALILRSTHKREPGGKEISMNDELIFQREASSQLSHRRENSRASASGWTGEWRCTFPHAGVPLQLNADGTCNGTFGECRWERSGSDLILTFDGGMSRHFSVSETSSTMTWTETDNSSGFTWERR